MNYGLLQDDKLTLLGMCRSLNDKAHGSDEKRLKESKCLEAGVMEKDESE